jgi:hypothetical protein
MESLAKFIVYLFLFILTTNFLVTSFIANKLIILIFNTYSLYWWFLIAPVNLIISFIATIIIFKIITKLN